MSMVFGRARRDKTDGPDHPSGAAGEVPEIRCQGWLILAVIIYALTSLAGCASLPKDMHAVPSMAVSQRAATGLGDFFAEEFTQHSDRSGFLLLDNPREALLARLALADIAERTLDLQYYIWTGDTVGRLMLERALLAADRGVRVRILLDDQASGGKDSLMAGISAHPNIEVRLYNPFDSRSSNSWVRAMAFLGNFRRLNHRMHNKLFIADNRAAVVGGRNLEDHYFGLDHEYNYVDLDLLALGSVVADVSESFDLFWNSEWSMTIEALHKIEPTGPEIEAARRKILENPEAVPYTVDFTPEEAFAALGRQKANLIWADSTMVYDVPRKDLEAESPDGESGIAQDVRDVASTVQHEMIGIFPYFVPSKQTMERWTVGVGNGIRIAMLTNSMGSNDVTVAQYGYRERRKRLLESGVELHELRIDAEDRSLYVAEPEKPSILCLHAKAAVFDRKIVFVGSMNFDPRSLHLNTETGLIVYSPELARQVAESIERMMLPQNSYYVVRESDNGTVWRTEEDGVAIEHGSEPDFGFWRTFGYGIYRLMPLDSQL
jgi:putative cardiolipin synthase